MAALSAAGKVLARRLLGWDRGRVQAHAEAGYDVSVYQARQDLAEVCIDADVSSWPPEVVDLFLAVLEVTRNPTPALQHGIGPMRVRVGRLSRVERITYRALASEIPGVLKRLRETSPRAWSDDDGEGD